jgi:AcrR family transcriptional regulator
MARPSDPLARSRLLTAAEQVFVKKGLDRAKVEDITQLAGLSKGAFYLHFESKEAIFEQLISAVLKQLEAMVLNMDRCAASKAEGNMQVFLEEWLNKDIEVFEFIWKNRKLMRLTLEGGGSAQYQHLIDDFAAKAERFSAELLSAGVELGFYREDLNTTTAATFIAGGYDRFARRLVRETKKPNIRAHMLDLQCVAVMGVGAPKLLRTLQRRSSSSKSSA